MTDCHICDRPIVGEGGVAIEDPWGTVYGYAHKRCYDNQEPPEPDTGAVGFQERYETDAARRR